MRIDTRNPVSYEYTTFPRVFKAYRWFKPILVGLLTVTFALVFIAILFALCAIWAGDAGFLTSLSTGYDDFLFYDGPYALANIGNVTMMLPALALAAMIVRDRPFSSYSSSRGGWKWSAFLLCLLVAFALFVVITAVELAIEPAGEPKMLFTPSGLIVCILVVPLQCIAEEYIFRGLILQTIASWTRLPILGVIVSALVFALGHAYNAIGLIAVFITGLVLGIIAWETRGIEATSALHVVNNTFAFLMTGFGLAPMTSQVAMADFVSSIVIDVLFIVVIIAVCDRKLHWFTPTGDGAAAFNAWYSGKLAEKSLGKHAS